MNNNKSKAVIEKFTKVTLIEWLRHNGWYAEESDISVHIEKPDYIEWHVKNERNQMEIIQWDEDGVTINSIYPLDGYEDGMDWRPIEGAEPFAILDLSDKSTKSTDFTNITHSKRKMFFMKIKSVFNTLATSVKNSLVNFKFGGADHGDIKWYDGTAYVKRNKSQYCGWYSALTGKKLKSVWGVEV